MLQFILSLFVAPTPLQHEAEYAVQVAAVDRKIAACTQTCADCSSSLSMLAEKEAHLREETEALLMATHDARSDAWHRTLCREHESLGGSAAARGHPDGTTCSVCATISERTAIHSFYRHVIVGDIHARRHLLQDRLYELQIELSLLRVERQALQAALAEDSINPPTVPLPPEPVKITFTTTSHANNSACTYPPC